VKPSIEEVRFSVLFAVDLKGLKMIEVGLKDLLQI
jgi:hypothetical protein